MTKKYLNIKEVSKIIGLKEHIIRYWDSVDPRTNKLRIDGISTKSKGGTRYFNKENLKKLKNVKNLLYEDGIYNPSLKLANRIISNKNINNKNSIETLKFNENESYQKLKKIDQILKKMRYLLKNS